nr:ABC sugar transporter, ATPase subunit [uncultured bacterium]BAH89367.1 ABC sugar transporter, ATPase subunit [uncultured bacterium]BAH89400.1 ABC sugar transporter, ATPase subunit [uncultured bacterium]BAH89474.1 ABC sugar transporter, ATPase subunit [uncultured bacterium]BAH89706.1 ABC sugar transporter, ATPase subunit [uncultured bacterium]
MQANRENRPPGIVEDVHNDWLADERVASRHAGGCCLRGGLVAGSRRFPDGRFSSCVLRQLQGWSLTLSIALQVNAISKSYGATAALQDVSFQLERGQVCGLIGENGAGKSTLVKSISGVIRPNTGQILLNGKPYSPKSIVEGNQRGVSTAFQELSLVPTLSVALNLFLPHPERNKLGLVPARKLEQRAAGILEEYGVREIKPSALIGDLPLGVRQRIEIVRAMMRRPSVLLLDEPTAALSDREWLFGHIDKVVAEGTSILYISHKLDEIRRLCSRCVILRNGHKVMDGEVKSMTDDQIFTNMAGRSAVETFTSRASVIRADARPRLEVRGLKGQGGVPKSVGCW